MNEILELLGLDPMEVFVSDVATLWDFDELEGWDDAVDDISAQLGKQVDIAEPLYMVAKKLFDKKNKG